MTADLVDVSGHTRPMPGPLGEAAVLVVDPQRDFADPERLPRLDAGARGRIDAALDGTRTLVDRARAAGVPVVWTRLEQDPDEPWDSSRWLRGLAGLPPEQAQAREPCLTGTPGPEWFGVEPLGDEEVVTKRRYSAFHGTDLVRLLYSSGVTWLVVCGLTTDCCVDATARDAFQHGFRVVVAADAVGTYEQGRQEAALAGLARHAAVVATVDAVTGLWRAGG
ncbi:cysteine hydrolase family protein [Nocardiopsis protaetiae]|uniref:cysteine hydrolase family protein n=1 Tax=Nocardiopsis protaetiae TaxID=3382270 RepID=UPI00387AAB36